ncbi:MAG: glycosyltransferase family 2 protein [Inconstantimicrobium porci]|nr:glycosyltransferase family 2 protein [Inconstantimicrobium porci]MDD6772179.1 glycosyltransferase family 2 protein [Inconstantimicrobium porci]MDY5913168.1 glycosyltransferase family 2 protein [Inconstantimicrobium porci]
MVAFKNIFQALILIITNAVFVLSMYYLIISLFGIIRRKHKEKVVPQKSFALIVAAHNEESVIKEVVNSLYNLDYPKDLYDVFVIADNCTDNTADVAEKAGANVYRRYDKNKRGKGFALEWMFNKIFKMDKKYDAVAIFDADNLVAKDFLNEMNRELLKGYKVVQGYLDSKNPFDTWITACYSASFWTSNRMIQLARNKLGLSNQLGGTGFCVEVEILRELGWGATCLTEDLEFTCKLVLNGYKVGWAHEAVIYDEKPLTLAQSWNQRKRWMQGFADVSSRYFFKLMKRAFTKFDFVAFDCALYSIQPIMNILIGLSTIITVVSYCMSTPQFITNAVNVIKNGNISFTLAGVSVLSVLLILYTPFLFYLDKKLNIKSILSLIILPVFTLTWFPISIQGILNKNDVEWSHTKHTRSMSIDELEKVN